MVRREKYGLVGKERRGWVGYRGKRERRFDYLGRIRGGRLVRENKME